LEDNSGLIAALKQSKVVYPVFILDPHLLRPNNPNPHSIEFMVESLEELHQTLVEKDSGLILLSGKPEIVIQDIIQEFKIEAVFENMDYSPYARFRGDKLQAVCREHQIKFCQESDYMLTNPLEIFNGTGKRYQVFTYFFKKAKKYHVASIQNNDSTNYYTDTSKISQLHHLEDMLEQGNPELAIHGGRRQALKILEDLPSLSSYNERRDIPADTGGTTHLSAHLKFGTVSIREVYHAIKRTLGEDHPLLRQLYWRDFYMYLSIHYPHVFSHSFKRKYSRIDWENDPKKFQRWCDGMTGFPIVDAGMRQLNTTGFMHNRVRMTVASFLVKDLHIDWKWGEEYFSQKLVDYDIMVNNGNWQWAASTGADSQPYFRIFNPWSQQKKFDPDCEYIKTYIPELQDLPPAAIHKLSKQRPLTLMTYPKPMINHKQRSQEAKNKFKAIG